MGFGNRDAETFKKLYEKIQRRVQKRYYTDKWDVYSQIIPKSIHVQGKQNTYKIEQNNSNIRHYLARMKRQTKVVSKSIIMVDIN
ncbi:MAG: IS1 family transposase [Chitinophagaceae bacterium]|nr:IS1 family transposase [Chitinophagaceae bacterium]